MRSGRRTHITRAANELRKDPVAGEWVLIAPNRVKRPRDFARRIRRKPTPVSQCLFEHPQASGNAPPILEYRKGSDWEVQVITNKYPAVLHKDSCAVIRTDGIFTSVEGVGYHELVLTRGHRANFPKLSSHAARLVFRALKERYRFFAKDKCLRYISMFHNWGSSAGASVYHPHYQIIALPIVPFRVQESLRASKAHRAAYGTCIHCRIIAEEKKHRKRIVYENRHAVVFVPFAPQEPFELRVFPKAHGAYFEHAPEKVISAMIDALRFSLARIERKLNFPDYNFFIHTAPIHRVAQGEFSYYHWHIEIQPKISIPAGFELGTGIEITVVDPDDAAAYLRR